MTYRVCALLAALTQAIQLEDAVLTITSDCDYNTEPVFTADSTETVNPALIDDDGTLIPRCDRSVVTADEQLSIDLWCAINDIRAHPSDYIPEVNRQIAMFTDPENPKNMVDPETGKVWKRGSGVEAWIGLKETLASLEPMETLQWNEALFKTANDHLIDTISNNFWGKNGSDGTSWTDQIEKEYTASSNIFRV